VVPPRIKATFLESQLIHMIQQVSRRTLSTYFTQLRIASSAALRAQCRSRAERAAL
jgi:hypothetical protein